MKCPMCNQEFDETRPAILRIDNKTKICSNCGNKEGLLDAFVRKVCLKKYGPMNAYNEFKIKVLKGEIPWEKITNI